MQIFNFILFLVALLYSDVCFGQDKQKKYKAGYLCNLGTASYVGDLTTDVQSITFQPIIGIGVYYIITPKFSIRSEVNYFRLSGKKYINSKNYLGFHSNNSEFSATVVYDIFAPNKAFIARKVNALYLFGGLGFTTFQSSVQKSGDVPEFRSINQNPFLGTTAVIPVGVGVRFKTTKTIDIAVELGYRKSFTDYLDNVTPYHNRIESGGSNAVATIPTENLNSGKKDNYFYTNFKLIYTPKYIFRKKAKSATATTTDAAKRNKKTSLIIKRSKKLETHKKSSF